MAQTSISIAAKGPNGKFECTGLTPSTTFSELLSQLSFKSRFLEIAKGRLKVKKGFPPKELNVSPNVTLSELGFASKETVIIEEGPPTIEKNPIIRKIVPADNKCLFTSIGYCIEKRLDTSPELRQIAAGIIASDPYKFNEVFLGMPNEEYVQHLLKDSTWGSAHEISVLSEYFGIEIVVQRFGVDKGYPERIFLLYDGIHYDPIVWNESGKSDEKSDITRFKTSDPLPMEYAKELGLELNKKLQFVDVVKFALRCGECYEGLIGEKEAMEHAKKTGHTNFQQTK